jgi:hypothetical protein
MPPKVVSIGNGVMNIHLRTEHGVHMVAALVPAIPGVPGKRGGLLYGRCVVRFRAESGYKTALLFWPDSQTWPRDGEIDVPDGDLTGMILAFVHRQGAVWSSGQAGFSPNVPYAGE